MKKNTITFDSFAWIEYFSGSKRGEKVKFYVEGPTTILTPSVCLTEIKARYLRQNKDPSGRLNFIINRSTIIDLDQEMALKAAELKIEEKLYTIDAIVYSAALRHNTKLLTGDKHFLDKSEIEMI
jgi:predicted nucleic acid-binding protein